MSYGRCGRGSSWRAARQPSAAHDDGDEILGKEVADLVRIAGIAGIEGFRPTDEPCADRIGIAGASPNAGAERRANAAATNHRISIPPPILRQSLLPEPLPGNTSWQHDKLRWNPADA